MGHFCSINTGISRGSTNRFRVGCIDPQNHFASLQGGRGSAAVAKPRDPTSPTGVQEHCSVRRWVQRCRSPGHPSQFISANGWEADFSGTFPTFFNTEVVAIKKKDRHLLCSFFPPSIYFCSQGRKSRVLGPSLGLPAEWVNLPFLEDLCP